MDNNDNNNDNDIEGEAFEAPPPRRSLSLSSRVDGAIGGEPEATFDNNNNYNNNNEIAFAADPRNWVGVPLGAIFYANGWSSGALAFEGVDDAIRVWAVRSPFLEAHPRHLPARLALPPGPEGEGLMTPIPLELPGDDEAEEEDGDVFEDAAEHL